jgi:hypothetical protein
MMPTRYIYLAPTFADEGVEDEHDWVEYPGRIVAGVLSELLTGLGCKVDQLYDEGPKGWGFTFVYGGRPFWARVGAIEDFLIVLGANGWFDLLGRKRQALESLVLRLDATLQRDPRFKNIRWYTQQQMDAGQWDYPTMLDRPQS